MAWIVQWAFSCFSWPSVYPCASIFFWRSVAPRTPQATVYPFWCSTKCPLVLLFWLYLFRYHTASWAQREENAWGLTMPSIQRKPLASGSGCRTLKACWDDAEAPLAPRDPPAGSGRSYPGIPLLGDFFLFALFPPHILYLLSFSAAWLLIILLIWRDQKHLYLTFLCFYLCISQSQ